MYVELGETYGFVMGQDNIMFCVKGSSIPIHVELGYFNS